MRLCTLFSFLPAPGPHGESEAVSSGAAVGPASLLSGAAGAVGSVGSVGSACSVVISAVPVLLSDWVLLSCEPVAVITLPFLTVLASSLTAQLPHLGVSCISAPGSPVMVKENASPPTKIGSV